MRKILFCLSLGCLVLSASVHAQVAQDLLKKANKAFRSYDPGDSKTRAKLPEIKDAVDAALAVPENQTFEGWFLKGKAYTEMGVADINAKQELVLLKKESEFKVQFLGAGLEGYKALKQALKLAVKKSDTRDVLDYMATNQSALNQAGSDYYGKQTDEGYANAYQCFKGVLDEHDILKANGKKSGLDDKEDVKGSPTLKREMLLAGATAFYGKQEQDAVPLYQKMIQMNADTGFVYEALFRATVDKDPDQAVKYLQDGQKKYPNDSHVLFALINYKLKTGKLDDLLGDLKNAITKEPKNTSLYVTLGNVYDQLSEKTKATDPAKSKEYGDLAMEQFHKTLQMDANNSNAIYSIGASYYNKAAVLTKELKELDSDNSKAGIAKFEAKQKEVNEMFNQALPYFKKAETIDPNDQNTLIALKEIFAHLDQLELSVEFKKRLENLSNNVKNTSYFAGKL